MPSLDRIRIIGSLIVLLCLIGFALAFCHQRDRIAGQKRDIVVARTTGNALDQVAKQTPIIQAEQKAKQDEVEKITGADQPLPAGFADQLERVRRGERH